MYRIGREGGGKGEEEEEGEERREGEREEGEQGERRGMKRSVCMCCSKPKIFLKL